MTAQTGGSISVVIPVHNGAGYLAEAIDSVLAQTLRPSEILVFDNASTDDTRAVATSRLPPECVVTFTENAGAAANMNRAAAAAKGDFVLWLAADDRLSPTHLEQCSAELVRHPETSACLPGIAFIDRSGEVLRTQSDRELACREASTRLRTYLRRQRWTEFYCLYRRDALVAAPPMSSAYGADVVFTWWFLLRAPLAVVEQPLLEYREYQKSQLDVALSLDPAAEKRYWLMAGVWRRLYAMTGATDLDPNMRRLARRELFLCLATESWMNHLLGDLTGRWPTLRRPLHYLVQAAVLVVRLRRRLRPSTLQSL